MKKSDRLTETSMDAIWESDGKEWTETMIEAVWEFDDGTMQTQVRRYRYFRRLQSVLFKMKVRLLTTLYQLRFIDRLGDDVGEIL